MSSIHRSARSSLQSATHCHCKSAELFRRLKPISKSEVFNSVAYAFCLKHFSDFFAHSLSMLSLLDAWLNISTSPAPSAFEIIILQLTLYINRLLTCLFICKELKYFASDWVKSLEVSLRSSRKLKTRRLPEGARWREGSHSFSFFIVFCVIIIRSVCTCLHHIYCSTQFLLKCMQSIECDAAPKSCNFLGL